MERIFREGIFGNHFPADEMFLNDAFQNVRRAGMIPHSFRVNDGDWPLNTDTKAVGLGAINQRLRTSQIQFLEPSLEKFPRLKPFLLRATFWLSLIGAKENVPFVTRQAQGVRRFPQFLIHASKVLPRLFPPPAGRATH